MVKWTEAQIRAMRALAGDSTYLTPAELGWAMTPDRSPPLTPQGAGRLGGTMGWRLERMGLVAFAGRPGRPRYRLTSAGRAAVAEDARR